MDAESFEVPDSGLGVGLSRLGVLVLIADQSGRGALETHLPVAWGQRQSVDQRIGGRANLAESDLWIFPPAAAGSGGPGTDG